MNLSIFTPGLQGPVNHSSPPNHLKYIPSAAEMQSDIDQSLHFLAHEIRNPLTNINLAIEALKKIMNSEEEKMYLDIIERNAARIRELMAALLKTPDHRCIKQELHFVRELLDEVLITNQDRFLLNKIRVHKNYSSQDFSLILNYAEMKLALTNIIINATEAMLSKEGLLEITTKLLRGFCFIIIKDNGTGMSKEQLNNIFTPFFTDKPNGMGLGLTGTLSILHSNNIGLAVRSDLGVGTTFYLSCKK